MATCFHTKRCGHYAPSSGRRSPSHHSCVILTNDATNSESFREEQVRQDATDALLPVFFPKFHTNSSASGNTYDECPGPAVREKPITAEASLKRHLRKMYQRPKYISSTTRPEEQGDTKRAEKSSRGRLAALTLGTGVMRLRHWYAVASQNNIIPSHDITLPIPYPLGVDPSILSLVHVKNATDGEELSKSSYNHSYSVEERLLVRAMVDEHAHYLSPTANHTLSILQKNSGTDTSIKLSIQYSLPAFLTKSLLYQYGYDQTKTICSLMNNPGPITIRRNAIQFPGTDQDLCHYLWKEDGIHAEPMSTISKGSRVMPCEHASGEMEHGLTMTMATSDGSNRYIVGSSSDSGSIMPPEGAIQILPPKENAKTIVEQRRSHKSIWSMKGWQNGFFEVQDAGSQLIVQSMEVLPGESILDYCAGNGGKTFGLASAIMHAANTRRNSTYSHNVTNNGTVFHSQIVAHDVVEERLRQIKGSLSRVGFVAREGDGTFNGTIFSAQSSSGNCECTIQIATSTDLDAAHSSTPSSFDAVLVDVPCSSTGVLRRRPSQRWDLTEKQIHELPELQIEILAKAASFVSENGGKLVYSTCSLLREENEDVVRKFEQSSAYREGGFQRWECIPMMESNVNCNDEVLEKDNPPTFTILPSRRLSDGFFIARWKRGI